MPSETDLVVRMAGAHPMLEPLLAEHLSDQEGELLPYVFLGEVAEWLATQGASGPLNDIRAIFTWLDDEYENGSFDVRNLIVVGFIEMLPASPAGDPVLKHLGPQLRERAGVAGSLLNEGVETGPDDLTQSAGTPSERAVGRTGYPALWQFLGAYLHQDWRDDYADTNGALSDFMTGEPAFAPALISEIDRLLATTQGSADTEAAILELGSFFVPSASGDDPRAWLLRMRDDVDRFTHRE